MPILLMLSVKVGCFEKKEREKKKDSESGNYDRRVDEAALDLCFQSVSHGAEHTTLM